MRVLPPNIVLVDKFLECLQAVVDMPNIDIARTNVRIRLLSLDKPPYRGYAVRDMKARLDLEVAGLGRGVGQKVGVQISG